MKNIILQIKADSVVAGTISNAVSESFSVWLWVALCELIIIVFLFYKLNKKGTNLKFFDLPKNKIRNAKNSDVDMVNLMNSINSSKDLYKKLSRRCHPDRFINSNKQELAEKIFQEISKYKRDFNKLSELKERAIIELNINFK